MAPRLLIAVAMFFMAAAPARADLLQLNWTHGGDRLAERRAARSSPRAPDLARSGLRGRGPAPGGVVRVSHTERVVPTLGLALQQATDPLVPEQWWRVAAVRTRSSFRGPASRDRRRLRPRPDAPGVRIASEHDARSTSRHRRDRRGPRHRGQLGDRRAEQRCRGRRRVPDAVLRMWDASPFGFLSEGSAIQGIYEAAKLGPGVINLSFGGEDDDPLLDDAIRFASARLAHRRRCRQRRLDGQPAELPRLLPARADGRRDERGRPLATFSSISPAVRSCPPGVHIPAGDRCRRRPAATSLRSGTSFSSPLVAAAAAWIWTMRPISTTHSSSS